MTLYWELSSSLSSGISPFLVVEKYLESCPLISPRRAYLPNTHRSPPPAAEPGGSWWRRPISRAVAVGGLPACLRDGMGLELARGSQTGVRACESYGDERDREGDDDDGGDLIGCSQVI